MANLFGSLSFSRKEKILLDFMSSNERPALDIFSIAPSCHSAQNLCHFPLPQARTASCFPPTAAEYFLDERHRLNFFMKKSPTISCNSSHFFSIWIRFKSYPLLKFEGNMKSSSYRLNGIAK
jgi:hypothetical protein